MAIGAQQEKMLGEKGESIFKNIYPSMTWTGWVNGFPNLTNAIPTLNFSERMPSSPLVQSKAVIFGNGNVALDVARLLLMPVESLKHTDIKEDALLTLSTSSIKHVNIVGRRGPGQVSFTTAELREIFKLASAHKYPIFTNRLDLIQNLPSTFTQGEPRTLQSITKLFKKTPIQQLDDWNINIIKEYGCEKSLTLTFLLSPKEFQGNVENEMASGILCYKNEYIEDQRERPLHEQNVQKTAIETTLEASLFVKCIGYSVGLIPGLSPTLQDPNTGRIMTDRNYLIAKFPQYENLFTSGWCRGGPSGQLANTMLCAYDAAESILEYISLKASSGNAEERQGRTWLLSRLKSQGTKYLLYKDWQKINEKEIELGRPLNKPREKLTELDSLGPFKHF